MKKWLIWGAVIVLIIIAVGVTLNATADAQPLNTPDKESGMKLMQVIDERKSAKTFAPTDLDDQTVAEILWAAYGTNKNGTRTIPTAKNEQNLKVYAIMKDGAYFYDGQRHQLDKVNDKDLRPEFIDQQDFVKGAPLTLVYVGSDPVFSPMHAGSSYQNVSLYAASQGLAARVRAYIDAAGLKKELGLGKNENVLISITVGNPQK